jgi:hypothetical protein
MPASSAQQSRAGSPEWLSSGNLQWEIFRSGERTPVMGLIGMLERFCFGSEVFFGEMWEWDRDWLVNGCAV